MLRRTTLSIVALMLVATTPAFAQAGAGQGRGTSGTSAVPAATRRAIDDANRRWMEAFNRGDFAAVGALYTADARVMAPGAETATGPAGAQAVFDGASKAGVKSAKLETVELYAGGQTTTELGRYTMMGADGQVLDTGRFIVVWKREGNAWKIHRDMWNSDRAPAGGH